MTACAGRAGPAADGMVIAAWGVPQNPLVPGDTYDSYGIKVVDSFLTGLLTYDPKTSAPVYENAASITTRDQQHFTVKLKPDWTFSDGSPVTASSYVDAWNYTALASNHQINSGYFDCIQGYAAVAPASGKAAATTMSGLKVVDSTTFTVALNEKFSTWPQTLGDFVFDPLPASFFKDPSAWEQHPVGDGPYRISSYTPKEEMVLTPSPGYRGLQRPQNSGIDFKVYTDPNAAYADLLSGKLDIDDDLPLGELDNAAKDLHGRYIDLPSASLSRLAFPLYAKGWSTAASAGLRQGISMAINRPLIIDKILHGTMTPATDWTAPGVSGYAPGLCGSYCTYDPVRAKQLIDAAGGLPGGSITISYNADGGNQPWVDAVCNSINNVMGDEHACAGRPVPTFAELRDQVTGRRMTGPFRDSWEEDYPLAQDFLQPAYTGDGADNDSGFRSGSFDSLVDEANAAPDTATADRLYQQAEKQLVTVMPVIPLWYENSVAGYSAAVSDVAMDGFRTPVYYAVRK
ncbi:peptide ABC transporter substrate-binding protein [Streptacidiphilus carbonis]|uniref:peptide ABC transporter substrate-binding protein n=1 Tax=Streptacidiphilus carbonis TaxID=105422 RepID=UPI0005AB1D4B|nr:ABC transporter substrate-binding protein [Streptacidiphilus carbonis]